MRLVTAEQLVDVGGRQQRAVAGREQDTLRAKRERPLDAQRRGGAVPAQLRLVDDLGTQLGGERDCRRLARHDEHALERRRRAERFEHASDHLLGELPLRLAELGGQPLLGGVE